MILLPDTFIELDPPAYGARGFGFYVASVVSADPALGTYWYLHTDGECRDYCNQSPNNSSGYFATVVDAWSAAFEFYDKYDRIYPYAISSNGTVCRLDGTNASNPVAVSTKIESEVMEF